MAGTRKFPQTQQQADAAGAAAMLDAKAEAPLVGAFRDSDEAMSSGGSFLNWLGQYDAAEQDRALERLSAYRTSLTDSYDLDMFSRIVAYLLGDRDGLTDAGRAAQERFRAMFG